MSENFAFEQVNHRSTREVEQANGLSAQASALLQNNEKFKKPGGKVNTLPELDLFDSEGPKGKILKPGEASSITKPGKTESTSLDGKPDLNKNGKADEEDMKDKETKEEAIRRLKKEKAAALEFGGNSADSWPGKPNKPNFQDSWSGRSSGLDNLDNGQPGRSRESTDNQGDIVSQGGRYAPDKVSHDGGYKSKYGK